MDICGAFVELNTGAAMTACSLFAIVVPAAEPLISLYLYRSRHPFHDQAYSDLQFTMPDHSGNQTPPLEMKRSPNTKNQDFQSLVDEFSKNFVVEFDRAVAKENVS